MSTGRRLAKRSIIGTKVCAPGPDGLWYSGVIQDVKTPPTSTVTSAESSSSSSSSSLDGISADTKFIVRFDFKTMATESSTSSAASSVIIEPRRPASVHISPAQTLRRNAMIKEFKESDLIGPGFRSIMGIQLQPGQRVFLTYNGRETSGDVISHDASKDEVIVKITAIGAEEPIELKKRLEEVRLLESRRSARLADQERDTDFARLADMGSDRRRTSHSIEMPLSVTPQNNSRKRPPSYTHDYTGEAGNDEDDNASINAAMILMNLSHSPKSPPNGEKWLGTSPGSSSASWSSGSSSPPLSDDGHAAHTTVMLLNDATAASARMRTTSVSTSDEGIVVDFKEEGPRKKRANKSRYKCMWKGCNFVEHTKPKIERHVRNEHFGNKKPRRSADSDGSSSENDLDFYYEDEEFYEEDDSKTMITPTSPPTLSHRDMARPPHEDPEYQRQIVGNFKQVRSTNQHQQQQHHNNNGKSIHHLGNNQTIKLQNLSTSPLVHHNYTWPPNSSTTVLVSTEATTPMQHSNAANNQMSQQQSHSPATYIKHARSSPRPSQSTAPYPTPTYVHHHHHNYSNSPTTATISNGSISNTVIHSNNSANNVLQQLSQQNVTVTAHHTSTPHHHHQQQHQQQQLSAVTITPSYHNHHQQQSPSQQHSVRTSIATVTANINQHQQHIAVQNAAASNTANVRNVPNSPNRRTRGENRKCRKVYGMDRKDQWCTQCRWKKACSRFGD